MRDGFDRFLFLLSGLYWPDTLAMVKIREELKRAAKRKQHYPSK